MTYSSEEILGQLKKVRHPEAGQDIVSLEMVKNVSVKEGAIHITLETKKQRDPFIKSIVKTCEGRLKEKFGEDVQVNITTETSAPAESKQESSILPGVKNIIAIASGKGGVGKSTVATNLAVALSLEGYSTGIIDADIFGPSLPSMFGVDNEQPTIRQENGRHLIQPIEKYGVSMLSLGLFVNPGDATVWRGPMASNAFKQLMTDGDWGELDYLLIDLPPGTSDIHLTLVQSVSVTGAVIVSTPQKVALSDAIKGISMFEGDQINVPILGLIENMAWFTPKELPENKYYIFGKEGCKRLAEEKKVPFLGQIPLVQGIREGGDKGLPVVMDNTISSQAFKEAARVLVEQVNKRNELEGPTKIVEMKRF